MAPESGGESAVDGDVAAPAGRQATQSTRLGHLTKVVVALVIALGLCLRIWILGRTPITSDQAVVGLMAREILHGHLFAFYWGQHYGGGEPYVVAALFSLFGESRLALGLAPVLLDAIAALLVWRIGRRLFDPRVAVFAALIFWIWPEAYVYLSTAEYGFRFLTLVCGLAVLLFALRLAGPRAPRLTDWAALGLFLGLGWWCSPEIAYFAVPALLWLVYRAVRDRVRVPLVGAVLFVATTALGALPWLAANVGHGYPSLRSVPQAHGGTWLGRLGVFFRHVAPLVLGVRLRGSGDWLGGLAIGVTLYVLLAVLVLTWVVLLALKRRAGPLVVFVILFPFAYAYSAFSWYWRDGRYAVYLAPVLALLVASALCEVGRRSSRLARAAPVLGLIAALALTTGASAHLAPYVPLAGSSGSRSGWTSWSTDPDEWVRPLVTALERSHVQGAYVAYWVAYTVTFEAHGQVVAADPGTDRYPPYLTAIARSPRQAWVFPTPSALDALNAAVGLHPWLLGRGWALADFESYLSRHDVAYRNEDAGYFTVVYPARAVAAAVVLRALGT
jgi:4-amino-4-deoxy-L-arabinose transferase-like glycosyltransferase